MKKILWFLAIICCSKNLMATQVITVKSNVNKATVYLQGVQLYSKAAFNLLPGYNELVFQHVSPYLDVNSIQANGEGSFVLVDASFQKSYKEKSKPVASNEVISKSYAIKIQLLSDSLEEIDYFMQDNNNKIEALKAEKNILVNNRLIKGEFKKDTLALLKDGLHYLRDQLFNINSEILKFEKSNRKWGSLKSQMESRLQNYQLIKNGEPAVENNNIEINEVKVTVLADVAATCQVEISYYCNNAGWLPKYEIRANGNATKIELKHLAQVYQNTGVDWSNAQISTSTGNPSLGNTAPTLSPYLIGYYTQVKKRAQDAAKLPTSAAAFNVREMPASAKDDNLDNKLSPLETYEMVNVNQSLLRIEYDIKLQYNIPSDGKYHLMSIQNKSIPAKYEFNCIPKLDKDAFLIAKLTNWEELNLIPGDANLFFDGSYVGHTFINNTTNEDTLSINLGRDKSFVVSRNLLKEKSKTRMVDNSKVITKTYEIVVKNTKSSAIALNLLDQIPISTDPNFKVELINGDQANLDESTGALNWNVNLKPKENKKFTFSYTVKCPVGATLALN